VALMLCRLFGIVALAALPAVAGGVEPAGRAGTETEGAAPAASVATPSFTAAEGGGQPFPVIGRGEDGLPDAVRETRGKLIEAARSGDMEQLRAVAAEQAEPPSTAFDDVGDPIDYLKSLASDVGGREILAILLEVLEAGHVHVDAGGAEEMYLWPYFAAYPLEALTPPQLVELFTLLASAEYEEMRSYGAYTFFRVGIGADGSWHFFLAGD